MSPSRSGWTVPAAAICLAMLAGGCGPGARSPAATDQSPSTTVSALPRPVGGGTPVAQSSRSGRHGGGAGGTRTVTAKLPADFPAGVPIPPGSLQGSTGAGGQWGVLLLASGSAAGVLSSTMAFYVAAGYTADSRGHLHRGPVRITVVVESRDHSNMVTNLAIGVTRS